jgi:hypothetical protein
MSSAESSFQRPWIDCAVMPAIAHIKKTTVAIAFIARIKSAKVRVVNASLVPAECGEFPLQLA